MGIPRQGPCRRRFSLAVVVGELVGLVLFRAGARAEAAGSPAEVQALPCRPTVACTADIVRPGAFEVEAGYAARLSDGQLVHGVPFLLKLSLARSLQLQAGGAGYFVGSDRWFDNVNVGLKAHLHDQDELPSTALTLALSIPTVEAHGYLRAWDVLATIHMSRDFGRLHADLNLGVNAWRVDTTARLQPWVALALTTELAHHLSPILEPHLLADAGEASPLDAGLLIALAWAPRRFVVLDAGVDASFVPANRWLTAFAGVTIVPAAAARWPQ